MKAYQAIKIRPPSAAPRALFIAWDILVWLGIIFPLLSGGIWLDRPGLKFEITQINAQVWIAAFFGFYLFRRDRAKFTQTFAVRLSYAAWSCWVRCLAARPLTTLAAAWFFNSLLWFGTALERHRAFETAAADLGIFVNALWNYREGLSLFSSVKDGIHLMADHQSPVLFAIGELFRFFPYPEFLLLIQAFFLCSLGPAVFFLVRAFTPIDRLAALAPWLVWLYFPLRNTNRFDFHPETITIGFFLWALVCFFSAKNWLRVLGVFCFLLALSGKESAAITGFGLALALGFGAVPHSRIYLGRWLALPLGMISLAVLYLNLRIVPGAFGGSYSYQHIYAHLGDSIIEVILSPFTKPLTFFPHLFQRDRFEYFVASLVPFAFLPLYGWRGFLAATPGYFLLLLTGDSSRITLGYHYIIEMIPGLYLSVALAMSQLSRSLGSEWNDRWRGITVLFFVCLLGTYGRSDIFFMRKYEPTAHQNWLNQELFPKLSDTSLVVPARYVPQVATREWVHHLPIFEKKHLTKTFANCVLLDSNLPTPAEESKYLNDRLAFLGYAEIYSCRGVRIFELDPNDTCFKMPQACR